MSMLEIKNLTASVGDKEILKGISLTVNPGEVHAIGDCLAPRTVEEAVLEGLRAASAL